MLGRLKSVAITNIVSPYGLAFISYGFFLFAWSFPPHLYSSYLNERDLMFLDPLTILYFTLCTASFIAGVWVKLQFGRRRRTNDNLPRLRVASPLLFLLVPLLSATILCLCYLIVWGGKVNFISLLASQQGSTIKIVTESGLASQGHWDVAAVTLPCVLCWSVIRASQLQVRGFVKYLYWLFLGLGCVVDILTCVATVDRTSLMPLVIGLAVVYIFINSKNTVAPLKRIARRGIVSIVAGTGLFTLVSFLRGDLILRALTTSLLGYTIVSYNRLAALLLGIMHYRYEGSGVYLFPLLEQSGSLNQLVPFADYFRWPAAHELWRSEFASVALAGLNPSYIWSGVFGYLYSDIGWFTTLYMILYGFVAAYLWRRFEKGTLIGLVFYPWMACCILWWNGVNFLLFDRILHLVEVTIALALYERLTVTKLPLAEGNLSLATSLTEPRYEQFTERADHGSL
jgi:hypothetical protein